MLRWLRGFAASLSYDTGPVPPADIPRQPGPAEPVVANTVLRVESRDACFPFEVHLMTRYGTRSAVTTGSSFQVAKAGIDRRTREIAKAYPLTESSRLRSELEVALSRRVEVEETGVVAWATCLAVQVDERFVHSIRQYEALRRRDMTRLWTREAEEAEIAFLGRMIDDPHRATAWWFHKNPDDIHKLVDAAQTFSTLQSHLRASESMSSSAIGDTWDEVLRDFQKRADPAAQLLMAHQINQIMEAHNLGDLAARARMLNGDPTVQ